MRSWPTPDVPLLPGDGVALTLHDTASDRILPVSTDTLTDAGEVGVYVCGITPYDSTHLGHAATYVAFDLAIRQLLDNGLAVHYVQNITDVDDPLFERAERDGVDWRNLGTGQIDLFRADMESLSVIPPRDYIGAIESVDEVITMVGQLLTAGAAYRIDDEFPDIYVDYTFTSQFGYESRYDGDTMARFFAERGGDPERPGKRHPMDALVWRAHREGEPSWSSPFGDGRPGWHVECSAIATNRLGHRFAIQGGGSDLRFPHHEFSAAHAEAAHGVERMADHYVHTGMIGMEGTKMSKSLGNLVFVSRLTGQGHDPAAIRLGLYEDHYRGDRDWSAAVLDRAEKRLERWRRAAEDADRLSAEHADNLVADVRAALADDLDTPTALKLVDTWCAALPPATHNVPASVSAGATFRTLTTSLLGVNL